MGILRRIRVLEPYGIRRFFYPLSVEIPFPDPHLTSNLGIATGDGRLLPLQVTPSPVKDAPFSKRLDFAVSLEPLETLDLMVLSEQPAITLDDPLHIQEQQRFRNAQRHFSMEFDRHGTIHHVLYDGVPHLRGPNVITRNGAEAVPDAGTTFVGGFPLNARILAGGVYGDGCRMETDLEITACKSWVMLKHILTQPQPGDKLLFLLPLAVSSAVITCDFGVGGGLYCNFQKDGDAEIHWENEFLPTGPVHWSVGIGNRIDYAGEVKTRDEFRRQCWFHLIDGTKALAVAITEISACCETMQISLSGNGSVAVAFDLGETAREGPVFGLCYHFLNDIPAIAAATNPQSILLPPLVRLLDAS